MNKRDRKKIYEKYSNVVIVMLIIMSLSFILLKSCHRNRVSDIKKEQEIEYVKKEKLYSDSIVLLNMKLKTMNVIKDTVYKKYTEYKTKIVIQKEQLINNEIDTITILQTYDAALAECDSLNSINDTIIKMHVDKFHVLDSVISNNKSYNNKLNVDIGLLNKQLKKQKVRSTGKTILWSVVSGCIGFGAGIVTGIFK